MAETGLGEIDLVGFISGREDDPPEEGQEPTTPEGPEPEADEVEDEGEGLLETFPREVVESLRKSEASYRTKLREAEAERDELRREKLSESEKDRADKEAAEARVKELEDQITADRLALAIRDRAKELNFFDLDDAVERISADDITFTDDGKPDGRSVKAAVERLVKEKPHLVNQAAADGDGDGGPNTPPAPNSPGAAVEAHKAKMKEQGAVEMPPLR